MPGINGYVVGDVLVLEEEEVILEDIKERSKKDPRTNGLHDNARVSILLDGIEQHDEILYDVSRLVISIKDCKRACFRWLTTN